MFTINAQKQGVEDAGFQVVTGSLSNDNVGQNNMYIKGIWLDSTNSYEYRLRQGSTPYLIIERVSYSLANGISATTTLTLSGFGTFTGTPSFYLYQGSASANYYLYCVDAGGSGSFGAGQLFPVTISGTTVTLGSAITFPTVAGATLKSFIINGSVVYAFFGATSSTAMNDTRKYSGGSWTTLTGAALASSIGLTLASSTYVIQHTCAVLSYIPNNQKHYFPSSSFSTSAIFDCATESWAVSDFNFNYVFSDVDFLFLFHSGSYTAKILTSAGVTAYNGTGYGSFDANINYPHQFSNIKKGLFNAQYAGNLYKSKIAYSATTAKKIKYLIPTSTGMDCVWILTSSGTFSNILKVGTWPDIMSTKEFNIPLPVGSIMFKTVGIGINQGYLTPVVTNV